jgi:hypothetical protein
MKLLSLFILLIIIASHSCKVECPCFDEKLLTWMPYDINDKLMYMNQQNDTLVFFVKSKTLSVEYKEKVRFKEDCTSEAYFKINDELLSSGFEYFIREDTKDVVISCYFGLLIQDNIYSSGDCSFSNIYCCLDTMTINNKLYDEVFTIERDTINFSDEIWKVIVANNYGIVKFYDRETGYEWTLIEE